MDLARIILWAASNLDNTGYQTWPHSKETFWMHDAQTQAMRMCSRHEQYQRWLFCIFIWAPKITRSTRFWSWCWPGGWAVRFEHFPSKKRSSARWIIFLVLSVTLFGTNEIHPVVLNASSFNFVLMLIHWNKNGEVSINPRVTTRSQRRDYLFTRCNAPPSPKSLLDRVKRICEAPGRQQDQASPCWIEPSKCQKSSDFPKTRIDVPWISFSFCDFWKFVFSRVFFFRSTLASPLKIRRIEPALRTEVQHAQIHRLVSFGHRLLCEKILTVKKTLSSNHWTASHAINSKLVYSNSPNLLQATVRLPCKKITQPLRHQQDGRLEFFYRSPVSTTFSLCDEPMNADRIVFNSLCSPPPSCSIGITCCVRDIFPRPSPINFCDARCLLPSVSASKRPVEPALSSLVHASTTSAGLHAKL